MKLIARFICDDRGQDIIEYALLGSFVSFGGYVGAQALGGSYDTWMTAVGTSFSKMNAKLP